MEITVIFPHQLFKKHPACEKGRAVYLLEHPWFFTRLKFHQQKLVLHRASMQAYLKELKGEKHYVECSKIKTTAQWLKSLKGVKKIHMTDIVEMPLEEEFINSAKKAGIELIFYPTPMFMTDLEWGLDAIKDTKKYFMASFYTKQRKQLGILVKNGKPVGGKWSFDAENRKAIPKNLKLPKIASPRKSLHIKEAVKYVKKHFKSHPGEADAFAYPTTHSEASSWLTTFFKERFKLFGDYEDAIVSKESFLFHSVLSPMLNIGLLTPDEVVEKALKCKVDINSKEGFIRQIIGWREFIHLVYRASGEKMSRSNHFKHRRKLPKGFWSAETGIEPIDVVIERLLKTAYTHHIERLMILGNFMLLSEINPDDVYTWFMEMYIDAYDWVMVPNVYAMSQYADGGTMTTKPYVSSSNYVLKMSDFEKGDWCSIWDGLFWDFINKHKSAFSKNMRLKQMVNILNKMSDEKRKQHFATARKYLN